MTGPGTGTDIFSQKPESGRCVIEILGPLGKRVSRWSGAQKGQSAFLVGGGIGIPPMLELAKQLQGRQSSWLWATGMSRFLDARTVQLRRSCTLPQRTAARERKGNVLDAIRANGLKADRDLCLWPDSYASGTESRMQQENGIECWISLEERMACGDREHVWPVSASPRKLTTHTKVHNKRVCKDGPVFYATEVDIMKNLKVTIAGVELKNPVMTASGTFGSGSGIQRVCRFEPPGRCGDQRSGQCAVAGKSHSQEWRKPPSGMLNAIGLQNPGIEVFL